MKYLPVEDSLTCISANATYLPALEKAGCWNCRLSPEGQYQVSETSNMRYIRK